MKYLRENLLLRFREIAELTGRDTKTVWASYNKSTEKMPAVFRRDKQNINNNPRIPVSEIKDRVLGAQESIVVYLKDKCRLSYHEIGAALERNDRTIWTAYHRAKKKQEKRINDHNG